VELAAIWLTLKLASITTLILILLATPLAWWLAHSQSKIRPSIEAITAMPLVMPPTVIGFYLLLLFSPENPIGQFWLQTTGSTLTFSFAGLVVASLIYSLPFMVQPLMNTFAQIGKAPIEIAYSLGARPWDTFCYVILPLSARGYVTASVLTFAHTIGEFGVVLMVGGNIPDETRVVSIAIYEEVETLNYAQAHLLSAVLVAFSFVVLLLVYSLNRRAAMRVI
jgi:molybdate transport system permease protein